MKTEWRTTIGAALFLLIVFVVYYLWSKEDTGSVLLVFGAAAYLMLGGFLMLQWFRRHRIPRPEDRGDGNYEDTAGEHLGFFPAASIWPAGIGLGATFISLALIFGTWYWLVGFLLLFGSIIGYAVESEAPEEVDDDPLGADHRAAAAASKAEISEPAGSPS